MPLFTLSLPAALATNDLESAEKLLNENKLSEAEQAFEYIMPTDPKGPRAYYGRARARARIACETTAKFERTAL